MKVIKFIALVVLVGVAFGGGYVVRSRRPDTHGRKILYWVDPMHPAYRSDKPGIAPDCGMQLEPVYADEVGPVPSAPAPRKVLYYRDPQNHDYKADKPGLNPETGNTLEPVYAEQPQQTMVAGTIRIPVERQQLIGVKFATAELADKTQAIRTVGAVAYDETRVAHVHPRIEGWVEKVFVDFTGELVKTGQPMLTIYSPEMLASQQEMLLAARARDVMANNPMASASQNGESLFQAARRRLQLWELGDDQIDEVLRTGKPIRSVTLKAPASGYVLQRNVFPNQKVTPDSDLYTLADLSRVWILADVFESDIPSIKIGTPARLTFPSGAAPVNARVSYVQPQVDPATRTMKVRLEAGNPGVRLKPDMFVNVEFSVLSARRLMVPADAVLDTGDRQTVFIDLGNGYFEPRQVVASERDGDRIVIRSGLAAGDRVVASGTFLVDSESQLKSAATSMGAPPGHEGMNVSGSGKPAPKKDDMKGMDAGAQQKQPRREHDDD